MLRLANRASQHTERKQAVHRELLAAPPVLLVELGWDAAAADERGVDEAFALLSAELDIRDLFSCTPPGLQG